MKVKRHRSIKFVQRTFIVHETRMKNLDKTITETKLISKIMKNLNVLMILSTQI